MDIRWSAIFLAQDPRSITSLGRRVNAGLRPMSVVGSPFDLQNMFLPGCLIAQMDCTNVSQPVLSISGTVSPGLPIDIQSNQSNSRIRRKKNQCAFTPISEKYSCLPQPC